MRLREGYNEVVGKLQQTLVLLQQKEVQESQSTSTIMELNSRINTLASQKETNAQYGGFSVMHASLSLTHSSCCCPSSPLPPHQTLTTDGTGPRGGVGSQAP